MLDSVSDNATLLIWDAAEVPPKGDWTCVLWKNFVSSGALRTVSIPELIETNAEILRGRYLAWIYELGEVRVQGRSVAEHLQAKPGFSFWWTTLLAEKCSYSKSPQISEAMRILAFEHWMSDRHTNSLVLVTGNPLLARCLKSWCIEAGVAFEWQRIPQIAIKPKLIRRLYQSLPLPFQGVVWLWRHVSKSKPLRGQGLAKWRDSKAELTFVSYLFNLNADALKLGKFASPYWAMLPDSLQIDGVKTNWLHLYVTDTLIPNANSAAQTIHKFNETGGDAQSHTSLEAFLDLKVVYKTLVDALRLAWGATRLTDALKATRAGRINLWPLFEEEWRQSTRGITAMSNALSLNLFESAFRNLPRQKVGVYLQENQGWEFAFVSMWKYAGHERLIGSPHSTIRFWDLRYFFDRRTYLDQGRCTIPLPDKVALNGMAASSAYREGGYPMEKTVEVEALRYFHLINPKNKSDLVTRSAPGILRLLVLTDYLERNTRLQMRLLEKAAPMLPKGTVITVKPHPACPVNSLDYPSLDMAVVMEPISELLLKCDAAFTSNGTSAAADIYFSGVPIICVLDPAILNQSPLRGYGDVLFVSTADSLARGLSSILEVPVQPKIGRDFFSLDSQLVRWRKLLHESLDDHVLKR